MLSIKEYILESITNLKPNQNFPHWLIYNFDYKLVYDVLNDNFNEVQKTYENNGKGYDFKCLKGKYSPNQKSTEFYLGIIYKTIDRKNKKIDLGPKEIKDNKINIPKTILVNDTYIGYILDDKLCLVKKEEFESNINNFKVDLSKLKPSFEYELNDKQKKLYKDIYDIYDNIDPNLKNDFKKIKELQEFEDIQNIIKENL